MQSPQTPNPSAHLLSNALQASAALTSYLRSPWIPPAYQQDNLARLSLWVDQRIVSYEDGGLWVAC